MSSIAFSDHEAEMLEAARQCMGRLLAPLELGGPRFRPVELQGVLTVFDSHQERFCVHEGPWDRSQAEWAADELNGRPTAAEHLSWIPAVECL